MTPALITTKQASDHLRLDIALEGSPADELLAELEQKMDDATSIVLDYLELDVSGSPPAVDWDVDTVPGPVRSAILIVLNALWDDRSGTGEGDYLKPDGAVANLLRRFRAPTLA